MTGRDFLNQAQRLLLLNAEEDWRTAISRASYAAFHVARAFFEALQFQVPKSDRAHSYLWLRLQNCGDGLVVSAGSDLNELRKRRNHADYDLNGTVTEKLALRWFSLAEQIIQTLEAAAADPVRAAAIQAEVIRYERDVLQDVTFIP